jgi:hypothetical protein
MRCAPTISLFEAPCPQGEACIEAVNKLLTSVTGQGLQTGEETEGVKIEKAEE